MHFDEFKRQVEGTKGSASAVGLIYLLLGKENYLKEQVCAWLIERYIPEATRGFNLSVFSTKETNIDHILSAARTLPMMGEFRMVIIKEAEGIKEAAVKPVKEYLSIPPRRSILIFDAAELDKTAALYKLLSKQAILVECQPLRGQPLVRWVNDYVKSRGFDPEYAAVQKLIDCTGSDLYKITNELEKIFSFLSGTGVREIRQEAILDLVARSRPNSVFELIDAVGRKQRKRALQILHKLLSDGEEPLKILAMLARHFRQLLIVKELLKNRAPRKDIMKEAQIQEFLLDEFLKQAKMLSDEEVATNFRAVSEADLLFKSTSINQKIYLEQMLCRSLRPS
jgi:DNA polymerase-3 subunit delta